MAEPPDLIACLRFALESDDTWGERDLHASDLQHGLEDGCPRYLWLRTRGYQRRQQTIGELLMFDQGYGLQERIDRYLQQTLPKGWSLIHWEQSLTGLLPGGLRGRIDRALRHDASGALYVLDYKTARGKAFQYMARSREPKASHCIQVRVYAMALDAKGAILLYIDREGSNGFLQFYVERDDTAVLAALEKVGAAIRGVEPPPVLAPKLWRRENKGPDSVGLDYPWRCAYCSMRDVSCPSALPPEERDLGILGKLADDGTFTPKPDAPAGAVEKVLALLEERKEEG